MRVVFGLFVLLVIGVVSIEDAAANPGAVKQDADNPELFCLAQNIYFEARGEPVLGKIAVGHVVLNRAADKRFPRRVCNVIRQGGDKRRHRCQFSWWCDGRSDRPRDTAAWKESLHVAKLIVQGIVNDPTNGALWYHATTVRPYWADHFTRYARIGQHIFYIDPDKAPTQVADASERD